jgi:F-type H+-transporting ATPase subunit delta
MKITKQTRRAAKQLFQLCRIDGLLDEERTRQVVQSIIKANRRDRLSILWYFQRLVRLDSAKHTATVESAAPLPEDLCTKIRAVLASNYGQGINVSFKQNPELIGGTRIKIGSDVYDASVQGRLAELEKRF